MTDDAQQARPLMRTSLQYCDPFSILEVDLFDGVNGGKLR
jgi:hypothetical protein